MSYSYDMMMACQRQFKISDAIELGQKADQEIAELQTKIKFLRSIVRDYKDALNEKSREAKLALESAHEFQALFKQFKDLVRIEPQPDWPKGPVYCGNGIWGRPGQSSIIFAEFREAPSPNHRPVGPINGVWYWSL